LRAHRAAAARAWLAALVAVLLGLTAACTGGAGSAEQLRQPLDTVASVASEGALLAEDVADARAWPSFVRAHARELADQADEQAEQLADVRVAGDRAATRSQAVRLALLVSVGLRQLQIMPTDVGLAGAAAPALRQYAEAARALEGAA
jgi:hypothetical protein